MAFQQPVTSKLLISWYKPMMQVWEEIVPKNIPGFSCRFAELRYGARRPSALEGPRSLPCMRRKERT
jgi:hypothetical protein